jgi:hypothetical protein
VQEIPVAVDRGDLVEDAHYSGIVEQRNNIGLAGQVNQASRRTRERFPAA